MHALMDIALITVVIVLACYYLEAVLEWTLVLGVLIWCIARYGNQAVSQWLQ